MTCISPLESFLLATLTLVLGVVAGFVLCAIASVHARRKP